MHFCVFGLLFFSFFLFVSRKSLSAIRQPMVWHLSVFSRLLKQNIATVALFGVLVLEASLAENNRNLKKKFIQIYKRKFLSPLLTLIQNWIVSIEALVEILLLLILKKTDTKHWKILLTQTLKDSNSDILDHVLKLSFLWLSEDHDHILSNSSNFE